MPTRPLLRQALGSAFGSQTYGVVQMRGSVVFVSRRDRTVASYRFRVSKLIPLLRQAGLNVATVHVRSGSHLGSAPRLFTKLLKQSSDNPRVVVFQKTVSSLLARVARSMGATVLLDMDDGGDQRIDGTHHQASYLRSMASWVQAADGVIVASEELARWVSRWNSRTYVIPTCIDVAAYQGLSRSERSRCVIGWVGSGPVEMYFAPAVLALQRLTESDLGEILLVGNDQPRPKLPLQFSFIPWKLELEPSVFGKLDIGIMPLPDNDRARMKAGFKLLQYMAAGLPVVASPIGANARIVCHGWNGYLARTPAQWQSHLRDLAADPELRQRMGANGLRYVRSHYGLERAAALWIQVLETRSGG